MDLRKLAEPFAPNEIEWRVGQAGKNSKGLWAKVLAYVTNRAIMQRLDDVCGPENWRNEFRYEQNGAVLCGISVYLGSPNREAEWVTKWDGAENTDIEAVKGGLSNSMKRAAVQWGIGRYLYDLEEGWATIHDEGQYYQQGSTKAGKEYPSFRWNPPKLPAWAIPGFSDTKPAPAAKTERPKRDFVVESITKAGAVEVRGKALTDHTTEELVRMQTALRSEGSTKHKDLLSSIILVLSDRPAEDVNVARMLAGEEKQQAGLTKLFEQDRDKNLKALGSTREHATADG